MKSDKDEWSMNTALPHSGRASVVGDSLTNTAKIVLQDVPYIEEIIYDKRLSEGKSKEEIVKEYLLSIEKKLIHQDRVMTSIGFKRSSNSDKTCSIFNGYEIDVNTNDETYPVLKLHFTRSRISTPIHEMTVIIVHVDPYLYHLSFYYNNILSVVKEFFLRGDYSQIMKDYLNRDEIESLHLIPETLREFLIKGENNG